MSERITAENLDEIVKKNLEIRDEIRGKALQIRTSWNRMQINAPNQLALQILKPYGLVLMPLDNRYWSGAIFVRNGRKIPVINTALPRANQYFTAWHEIYHLIYDPVSFSHVIGHDSSMEERKAEYFASLMLLGNLLPYYTELSNMDFTSKVFHSMATFTSPYKSVLIALYESAVQNGNSTLMNLVKENFDNSFPDIAAAFRTLGLDDSLVTPSYVVNVSSLQAKITQRIRENPDLKYNHENERFLQNIVDEIRLLAGDGHA